MRDIVKLGVILMFYSLVAGTALALVNLNSLPLIEKNRVEAENNARAEVLPGMSGGYDMSDGDREFTYWTGYSDTEKAQPGGYIFIARGKGYSSTVETMVGVGRDGAITGLKVLFQQETPGLGARVSEILHGESEPWFTRQFIGAADETAVMIRPDGGNIDAITGATVTSRAVAASISSGLVALRQKVGGFR